MDQTRAPRQGIKLENRGAYRDRGQHRWRLNMVEFEKGARTIKRDIRDQSKIVAEIPEHIKSRAIV